MNGIWAGWLQGKEKRARAVDQHKIMEQLQEAMGLQGITITPKALAVLQQCTANELSAVLGILNGFQGKRVLFRWALEACLQYYRSRRRSRVLAGEHETSETETALKQQVKKYIETKRQEVVSGEG